MQAQEKATAAAEAAAKKSSLTTQEMTRLSARTAIAISTVRRWATGENVTPHNARELRRAAGRLGIPLPGMGLRL